MFYLQGVAGVILGGLVFEGLSKEKCFFVVNFIPVWAIAHVQN